MSFSSSKPFESFEHIGVIQKTGKLVFPRAIGLTIPADTPVAVELLALGITIHTYPTLDPHNGAKITVPKWICERLTLPLKDTKFWVEPSRLPPFDRRDAPTLFQDRQPTFISKVYDGSMLRVPMPFFRGMEIQGWAANGRAEVHVELRGPFGTVSFDQTVTVGSNGNYKAATLYVPTTALQVPIGVDLTVTISPRHAVLPTGPLISAGVVNWQNAPLKRGTGTVYGDTLRITRSRSITTIRKETPLEDLAWFLGFLLADGSKKGYQELTVTQKNPLPLGRSFDVLQKVFRLKPHDFTLHIKYGWISPHQADVIYRSLGIPRGSLIKGDRRDHSATLCVKSSLILADMVVGELLASLCGTSEVLGTIHSQSKETRKQFLLGYLIGDGNCALSKKNETLTATLRMAAASAEEAAVMAKVYDDLIRPDGPDRAVAILNVGGDASVDRPLTLWEAVRLLTWGGFDLNLNRVRLFHYAADVIRRLAGTNRAGFASHGYFDGDTFSKNVIWAIEAWTTLSAEWRYIQMLYPTSESCRRGLQGVPYQYNLAAAQATVDRLTAAKTVIAARKQTNDPKTHHPVEKQEQIVKVLGAPNSTAKLQIYEAHAGQGGCTATYKQYGDVLARTQVDGDDILLLAQEVTTLGFYDVVDLDPYGFPLRMIDSALHLLRIDSVLFVTCPNPQRIFHRSDSAAMIREFGLNPAFNAAAFAAKVIQMGAENGLHLVEAAFIDLGTVWRFAFQGQGSRYVPASLQATPKRKIIQ